MEESNKKKYVYKRLSSTINLNDDEFNLLDEIVEKSGMNKNQIVTYALREYFKKYTDENKQDDVNTFNNNENNNIIVDNQNNNNISIGDLNNSINILNQSINNLADLIKKDNTNND
ncbi:unnamed protein product [Brachyspira suanatina]|uniref:Uncharacterized protein n=1 Tax=Brachyspira suanatina TaxID=381802 RepID=A0A0G4K6E4_9SPIR|nr:hypothetical protein [Brachyspira suanatina]CRF33038.1 unnamed protein product [Brachyspira suanatina]